MRINLGLTQTDVATYVGMQRTAYIKAENGISRFKSQVLSKLIALELALTNGLKRNTPLPDNFPILVKRKEKKRKYRISLLEKKLSVMETDYERFKLLYTALTNLEANTNDELWVSSQIQNAINKIQKCNLANQQEIKERIYLLESEEKLLTEYRLNNQLQLMNITSRTQLN